MNLTTEDKLLIQLSDCFTAGYTLPQYCIDNGIKKPLFVAEKKNWRFVWQIYVQFYCDKRFSSHTRLISQFSFLDEPSFTMDYSFMRTYREFSSKEFSQDLLKDFDKVFVISVDRNKVQSNKAVYLDHLVNDFIKKVYYEIPILHFLQRHPGVNFIMTSMPPILRYKDGEEFMREQLPRYEEMILKLLAKDDTFKTTLDDLGYTRQESLDITRSAKIKEKSDGTTTLRDDNNPLVNIHGGHRMTAYQPEKFLNRIYFVGSCHAFGMHAPYDKTISSYLQKMLNEAKLPYRVENDGQSYYSLRQNVFYNLNNLKLKPGDIIFALLSSPPRSNKIPFCDMSDAFDPPHDYKKMFCTLVHANELGYKLMAEKYFKYLTENNFFRDAEFNYHMPPRLSQIWYTSAIRAERHEPFRRRGAESLQENSSSEKNSRRRTRYELQAFHSRSSIPRRIRGGSSRQALYLRRRGGQKRISLRGQNRTRAARR